MPSKSLNAVLRGVLARRPYRKYVAPPVDEPPIEPPIEGFAFTEDTTTDFPNPERGWYVEGTFGSKTLPSPVSGVVSENRPTLHLYYVNLRAFLYTDTISGSFLSSMVADFAAARAAGVKLIVRHAYNRSDSESPEDVSLARMQAHITQLAPYWAANQDVIACLQAGFVGPWGEMWRSDYVDTNAERQTLIAHLMANTPSTMMVQWRDPGVWTMYTYPTGATYSERFTGTAAQRAAHWNDCFANGYEMVTYWDGNWTTEQQMAYVASIGKQVVLGGESCQDTGNPLGQYSDGDYILGIMENWGWDYLNGEYAPLILSKWASSGHLAEISRRMGYRLSIVAIDAPTYITAGQQYSITIQMKNAGFGKVYNPRPIDLVWVGPQTFTTRLTEDARRELPLGGETVSSSWGVTIPEGVAGGSYALHLALPDPDETLASNPDFSIRLANTDAVWNASTGRHSLGINVTVQAVPPPNDSLLGVGSASDSMTVHAPTGPVYVGDWYVDRDIGNDNAAGTSLAAPFATIEKALSVATTGQTILVRKRASPYVTSARLLMPVNGVRLFGYGTERPVVDASNHSSVGYNAFGVHVPASNCHIKGFEWVGVKIRTDGGERAVSLEGDGNKVEDVWVHDSPGGSFCVYGGDDNVFMDCAGWKNGDGSSTSTNVIDQFVTTGSGLRNTFVRCYSENAPDDAFDCYTGNGALFWDCVAVTPGQYWNGNPAGDGNGIKAGGSPSSGPNTVRGCLVIGARSQGIVHNSSPYPNGYYRNTVAGCGSYGIREDNVAGTVVEDNISYDNGTVHYQGGNVVYRNNTWNLGISNPMFAAVGSFDYSLAGGSPCRSAGYAGGNLGASEVALALAKEWLAKNLT